jgi:hypothetical protein
VYQWKDQDLSESHVDVSFFLPYFLFSLLNSTRGRILVIDSLSLRWDMISFVALYTETTVDQSTKRCSMFGGIFCCG